MITHLLRNLELILTGIGVLIIFIVPALITHGGGNFWSAMAIVALGVGVLHGLIFWWVRRRQRRVRHETIRQVRAMLHDVVKNELASISFNLSLTRADHARAARIQGSVQAITDALDALDAESLQRWQHKYGHAAEPLDQPAAWASGD